MALVKRRVPSQLAAERPAKLSEQQYQHNIFRAHVSFVFRHGSLLFCSFRTASCLNT
jgi:hypothetical protein